MSKIFNSENCGCNCKFTINKNVLLSRSGGYYAITLILRSTKRWRRKCSNVCWTKNRRRSPTSWDTSRVCRVPSVHDETRWESQFKLKETSILQQIANGCRLHDRWLCCYVLRFAKFRDFRKRQTPVNSSELIWTRHFNSSQRYVCCNLVVDCS